MQGRGAGYLNLKASWEPALWNLAAAGALAALAGCGSPEGADMADGSSSETSYGPHGPCATCEDSYYETQDPGDTYEDPDPCAELECAEGEECNPVTQSCEPRCGTEGAEGCGPCEDHSDCVDSLYCADGECRVMDNAPECEDGADAVWEQQITIPVEGVVDLFFVDTNADTDPELLAVTQMGVNIYHSNAASIVEVPISTQGIPVDAATADLDLDGDQDLLLALDDEGAGAVVLLENLGDDEFAESIPFGVPNGALTWIGAGDFDDEGRTDIAVLVSNALTIFYAGASDTYTVGSAAINPFDSFAVVVRPQGVDGFVYSRQTELWRLLGPELGVPELIPEQHGMTERVIASGRFDQDDQTDYIVVGSHHNRLHIAFWSTDALFQHRYWRGIWNGAPVIHTSPDSPDVVIGGDLELAYLLSPPGPAPHLFQCAIEVEPAHVPLVVAHTRWKLAYADDNQVTLHY